MIKRPRGRPKIEREYVSDDIKDVVNVFTHEEKLFIIRCVAERNGNAKIHELFRKEFGKELSIKTQQLNRLRNPNNVFYNDDTGEYRNHYYRCSTIYEQQVAYIPITSKAKRLERLEEMYQEARTACDLPLAASLLKQAAQEVGDVFTNRVNAKLDVSIGHMSIEDIDKKLAEMGYAPTSLPGEVITLEEYEVVKQN